MSTLISIIILIYILRKNYLQNKMITRLIQEVGILTNKLKGENK